VTDSGNFTVDEYNFAKERSAFERSALRKSAPSRTAYDARASYIVSGDRHLLQLRRFRRTRIVEVEEMLRILD